MSNPFEYGDPYIAWNEENEYVDDVPEHDLDSYGEGEDDGYAGRLAERPGDPEYMSGYRVGQSTAEREHNDYRDYDPWTAAEQGFYDDDPNPYHGDYSEM